MREQDYLGTFYIIAMLSRKSGQAKCICKIHQLFYHFVEIYSESAGSAVL